MIYAKHFGHGINKSAWKELDSKAVQHLIMGKFRYVKH